MIRITDKAKCCGCSACSQVCPVSCIKMKSDEEGFLYPEIDVEICIGCKCCEKVCPIINKQVILNEIKKTYVVQNKDKSILKQSTSGGFFTALADWVIDQGGVVFGAAYDNRYYVCHSMVETKDHLGKFRNSKYTQSDISGTYKICKEKLDGGKLVCFSGTPCEIEGLYNFLGKKYENLILVDVVCRGVPSPLLFKKYLEWCGGIQAIKDVKFRDKQYGYYASTMSVYMKDGKIIRREKLADPMINFFFRDICSRPSCYECRFKTLDRVSDFTMFDCWHANKHDKQFGALGATAVVARNKNAVKIIQNLIFDKLICVEIDFNAAVKDDGMLMTQCASMNQKRGDFFNVLRNENFETLLNKYLNKGKIQKWKILVKTVLMRTGAFNILMKKRMSK